MCFEMMNAKLILLHCHFDLIFTFSEDGYEHKHPKNS
jgi:hypothetical protein